MGECRSNLGGFPTDLKNKVFVSEEAKPETIDNYLRYEFEDELGDYKTYKYTLVKENLTDYVDGYSLSEQIPSRIKVFEKPQSSGGKRLVQTINYRDRVVEINQRIRDHSGYTNRYQRMVTCGYNGEFYSLFISYSTYSNTYRLYLDVRNKVILLGEVERYLRKTQQKVARFSENEYIVAFKDKENMGKILKVDVPRATISILTVNASGGEYANVIIGRTLDTSFFSNTSDNNYIYTLNMSRVVTAYYYLVHLTRKGSLVLAPSASSGIHSAIYRNGKITILLKTTSSDSNYRQYISPDETYLLETRRIPGASSYSQDTYSHTIKRIDTGLTVASFAIKGEIQKFEVTKTKPFVVEHSQGTILIT